MIYFVNSPFLSGTRAVLEPNLELPAIIGKMTGPNGCNKDETLPGLNLMYIKKRAIYKIKTCTPVRISTKSAPAYVPVKEKCKDNSMTNNMKGTKNRSIYIVFTVINKEVEIPGPASLVNLF